VKKGGKKSGKIRKIPTGLLKAVTAGEKPALLHRKNNRPTGLEQPR
jgi:hypothetical protein